MKFKDPRGNILVDIESAHSLFCARNKSCSSCGLGSQNIGTIACAEWAADNPNYAASLMGHKIIE